VDGCTCREGTTRTGFYQAMKEESLHPTSTGSHIAGPKHALAAASLTVFFVVGRGGAA
jgi:hypothetical protein